MTVARGETHTIKEVRIGKSSFEKVKQFKYLGVLIDSSNERSVEIKERIKAGNRVYWKYQKLLKDRNLSRKTKIKIYKAAIRPVITYGAEVMCLSSRDEEDLRVLERKIMRSILGPRREDGKFRPLMNHEIREINNNEDIGKFIKAQRLKWFGHIQRRGENSIIKKLLTWKPKERRPRGRPKVRWIDQIMRDIKELGITNWRDKVKTRKEWSKITTKAKSHTRL